VVAIVFVNGENPLKTGLQSRNKKTEDRDRGQGRSKGKADRPGTVNLKDRKDASEAQKSLLRLGEGYPQDMASLFHLCITIPEAKSMSRFILTTRNMFSWQNLKCTDLSRFFGIACLFAPGNDYGVLLIGVCPRIRERARF